MDNSHLMVEKFIEGLPTGIIVLDSNFNVLAWNKLAFQLLDIAVEDLLAGQFNDVVKNQTLKDALNQIQNRDAGKQDFFIEKEGQTIKCAVGRLHHESDEEDRIIIIVEDATKYKQLDSMKQEFMQIILHRIRNPLSTLKTSLSLINSAKIAEVPQELKEILEMSTHEVNRLNALLNDLRNLYVIETGLAEKELDIESFTVADILDRATGDLIKLYRDDKEINKQLSLKGDLDSPVKADFEKLKQVLVVLLINAYNFSPTKSPIEITASQNNGQTTIEVKDYGIGIADDKKKFIFTKFFREDNEITRSKEGNGLGLFIARSLIEIMKGAMYCESQKGVGSSFFINLPSA